MRISDRVIKLAERSGFCLWDNEPHKPEDATIDWASSYDNELQTFYELTRAEVEREYGNLVLKHQATIDRLHELLDIKDKKRG